MAREFLSNEQRNIPMTERLKALGMNNLITVVAQGAAVIGARRVRQIYGAKPEDMQTVYKAEAGMTPRTVADLQSGAYIRRIIKTQLFPGHAYNDEETGEEQGTGYKWYVDPLDGTSSFARGQRYSTTGISVYEGENPKAASICNPFERELLVGATNKGAYKFDLNESLGLDNVGEPKKLEVSKANNLQGGIVYLDALFNNKTSPAKLKLMGELVRLAKGDLGFRMSGSNIDQQRQVACGRAELTITDAVGGFYDLAAGSLLIKEAGGSFTDADGNAVNEKTQVAIGGNEQLVAQVLPILRECYKNYEGFK